MKKIVCILSSLSQPRCIKRVLSLYHAGYSIEVYGYERGYYNINTLPEKIKVTKLGTLKSGSGYIQKLFFHIKQLSKLFTTFKNQDVVYYAFAFDIALVTMLFSKKRYIYEISDLVYGYFKLSVIRCLLRWVDRIIIEKSLLTVLTSQGFNEYLKGSCCKDNVLVIPNKVNSSMETEYGKPIKKFNIDQLSFSYIGAFRYPNTVFRFAEVIGKHYPKHQFHFFGDSPLRDHVQQLAKMYTNVYLHGPFKNPDDLTSIYNQVDIVVACYDTKTFNERVAEPNKLYESLFFSKPIIVSKGTYLARKVEELQCGYSINATSDENIIDYINSLTAFSLSEVTREIVAIPLREKIDDPTILINKLREFIEI